MSDGRRVSYLDIVRHYEQCLGNHGDTHQGVDWPNADDAETRYRIMLDVVRKPDKQCTLLDFGCGASHLKEYIQRHRMEHIAYSGLDLSPKFIALCRRKFPSVCYYCADILQEDSTLPDFDYVVMNGVFTEKCGLTWDEMREYFERVVTRVFAKVRIGMAFNVMSKQVDWEREDLFYLSHDILAAFLAERVSRHFVMRNDYGLYEYTTYVYRNVVSGKYTPEE